MPQPYIDGSYIPLNEHKIGNFIGLEVYKPYLILYKVERLPNLQNMFWAYDYTLPIFLTATSQHQQKHNYTHKQPKYILKQQSYKTPILTPQPPQETTPLGHYTPN